MGLAIWLCTVIAERLSEGRVGRAITTAVALFVIVWALILAVALFALTVMSAFGHYP